MANIKQWEKEINKLETEQIKSISKALETLKQWDLFNKEFEWTQYGVIKVLCECELKYNRGLKNGL